MALKILHLTTFDNCRGAAIAAKRLHEALLAKGVESWMLCDIPSGEVFQSVGLRGKQAWLKDRIIARFYRRFVWLQNDPDSYYYSINLKPNNLLQKIEEIKPDIVHLHWVGKGLMRIENLPMIAKKYPVVWTLHDMWPFCGAEHITYSDDRWLNGYTKTNRSKHASGIDINRWVWRRKMINWSGCTIHTIGVSSWINECVSKSRLFKDIFGMRCVIHNGLNDNVFQPPKLDQRDVLDIISSKRSVRIVCLNAPKNNWLKGGDLLSKALRCLHNKGFDVELVTFGGGSMQALPIKSVKNWGQIDSPDALAAIYASADLMVTPSRMESFGQTAVEALACKTPVVCFNTTGLRDIIEHKKNGYRAQCFKPEDLALGIEWCISDSLKYKNLQENARTIVLEKFRISDIADQTMAFYRSILDAHLHEKM